MWEPIFNTFGTIAALLAAGLWFRSAALPLPPQRHVWNSLPPEQDEFYQSLLAAARWNRWAAACSGVSALCFGLAQVIVK
jgi:hypothetical protein